ncbi:class I SAM-dependent methyltransferase [Candidatus Falkowbacteria bacterium]|nr:class I SAM-dependent methyltransferase [Candidatus Falkowbacteria bacterium]
MNKKTFYIEDRENWSKEYGSLLDNLPAITTFFGYVKKHQAIDKDGLRVLDYGCAYGYYLKIIKAINPKALVYGVDISKDAVRKAQENINESLPRVFWLASEEPLPLSDNNFDTIFSLDVIEHVKKEEAEKILKKIAQLLKPSGLCFIATPNCSFVMKIIYILRGRAWIFRGHDHLKVYNKKTLNSLLKKYFKVKKIDYYHHKNSFFRKLLSILGISTHLMAVLKTDKD